MLTLSIASKTQSFAPNFDVSTENTDKVTISTNFFFALVSSQG